MKLCAVVCEYNPFHNGHAYQLDRARRETACDGVLCVMSGNFVQRAEPAVADKYVRAKCALLSGADIVLELPTVYAAANAERFATGAVELIAKFPKVKFLVMGCENDDETLMDTLAEIQLTEPEEFKKLLTGFLEGGNSYAKSYASATAKFASTLGFDRTMCDEVLCGSNNLLCIEYIKALKRTKSKIKPFLIKRKGTGHNSTMPGKDVASATAIRAMLDRDDLTGAQSYMPTAAYELISEEIRRHRVDRRCFEALVVDRLRAGGPDYVAGLYDCGEGIEHKLCDNAMKLTSLPDILAETKSKRYTMTRLKRLCLQALLGITKSVMRGAAAPSRVLAIKEDFKYLLSELPAECYVRNSELAALPESAKPYLHIDRRAAEIYTLLARIDGTPFFTSPLVTI